MLSRSKCVLVTVILLALVSTVRLAGAAETKKITFSNWYNFSDEVIQKFTEETGIVVEQINLDKGPTGGVEAATVAAAGGAAPDVIMFQHSVGSTTIPLLEDLGPYMERDRFDMNQYVRAAVMPYNVNKTFSPDGQLALPILSYTGVIFYNQDLFDKAGIPTPMDLFLAGEWNYETFEQCLAALTKDTDGDGQIDQWGMSCNPSWIIGGWIGRTGAKAWTLDGRGIRFTEQTYVDALQWFSDLMNQKKYIVTDDWKHSKFIQGKVGVIDSAAWMSHQIENAGVVTNWGIAPLPTKSPDVGIGVPGGDAIGICKFSKNKDAAWEFIKYMTGDYVQDLFMEQGNLPVKLSSLEKMVEKTFDTRPYDRRAYVYSMIELSSEPDATPPIPKEADDLLWTAITNTYNGTKDAATALAEIAPAVQEILAEYWAEQDAKTVK